MIGLLASIAVLFLSQDPAPRETCSACADRGSLPCPAHKKQDLELEKNVLFCSEVIKCRTCGGVLEIDCDECAIGDKQIAYAREEKERWLEKQQQNYELLQHEFPIGRSPHFELWWDGDTIVAEKRRLSDHAAMHLYVDRLEDLYQQFKAATGATDEDFSTVFQVMVWKRYKHHQIAAGRFTGQPNPDTGTKRMGAVGIYTVFLDPSTVDPDESAAADLYRAIVHNVSHLLLANAWNGLWPGELQGGWVDTGVAHYFEDKLHGRCTNFCYREQDTISNFRGARWRAPARTLAAANDRPSFAETIRKKSDELSYDEHILSWSYCEFLISRNPAGFGAICRAIKQSKSIREPMLQHFEFDVLNFEEAWQAHVKATYRGR
ncbi:MAG: hypothetical protein HY812_15645 [Planctomycetes bacterium]|nr:hypothetical protein [Planctomycetota bacterium]